MDSHIKIKIKTDEGSGRKINTNNQHNTIRCMLQNPSGVMKINAIMDNEAALTDIDVWDVDVLALPETNRNWKSKTVRNKWVAKVKNKLPNSKIIFARMHHKEKF